MTSDVHDTNRAPRSSLQAFDRANVDLAGRGHRGPQENRRHESIGYDTPEDEHHGRGAVIRKHRRDDLTTARAHRIATRRQLRQTDPEPPIQDEDI